MVSTRLSLAGDPSPSLSSTPTATRPPQLSRAQQAALKKLQIAGTAALKGDAKVAAATKEAVATYHYRGAVYAADANTPSEWLENQPKRYLKWASVGAGVEEDEERPAKRQRRSLQGGDHELSAVAVVAAETAVSARGRARAGRGSGQSLEAKRKAAVVNDEEEQEDRDSNANMSRRPNWFEEHATERRDCISQRTDTAPASASRPPIPQDDQTNNIPHTKEEAALKNCQVAPLGPDALKRGATELVRQRIIKLAQTQRAMHEKMREYNLAKELLERKRREVGLDPPPNGHENIAAATHGSQIGVQDELGEQWERDQEQICAAGLVRNQEIPESWLPATQSSKVTPAPATGLDAFTRADASHPQTPVSAEKQNFTASTDELFHKPAANRATPTATSTPSTNRSGKLPVTTASTPTSARTTTSSQAPEAFTFLPPNAQLPTQSKSGAPLRWSITPRRASSINPETCNERAEWVIDVARLEGESKSARNRRVKREMRVVESWGRVSRE
jgi:hypothetical protein